MSRAKLKPHRQGNIEAPRLVSAKNDNENYLRAKPSNGHYSGIGMAASLVRLTPGDNEMTNISRRIVLRRIATAAPAALLATTLASQDAAASGSVPQSAAGYQDKPNGDKQCDGCSHFAPPSSCKVVAGTISPSGWCKLFAAK